MCKKCNGEMKLISYKWNNKELIFKYKCDECDEIKIVTKERNDEELKSMIDNSDLYNNL